MAINYLRFGKVYCMFEGVLTVSERFLVVLYRPKVKTVDFKHAQNSNKLFRIFKGLLHV